MHIVLGGTSGLGAELVAGLRERGEAAFVTGSSYTEARHGAGMAVDLASENSVDNFVSYVHGIGTTTIKGFYWTAGIAYKGELTKQPNAHEMALINFANVVPIAQAVWEKMIEQAVNANFVVVSSSTGLKARPDEMVYSATKFAQVGYGRSAGLEATAFGLSVRVSLFEPGGMKTPLWDTHGQHRPDNYDEFLNPSAVANYILDTVAGQTKPFLEKEIPKGSV